MLSLTAKTLSLRNFQLLLNVAFFYAGSLIALLLGNIPALGFCFLYAIVHGFVIQQYRREWLYIGAIVLIGASVDSLWGYLGMINFKHDGFWAPPWLVCMWFLFSTTLCHSLSWLRPYLFVSVICGAIAGPFSYYFGAKLSDVQFAQPLWMPLLAISIFWAVLFPLLLRASDWVRNENE